MVIASRFRCEPKLFQLHLSEKPLWWIHVTDRVYDLLIDKVIDERLVDLEHLHDLPDRP